MATLEDLIISVNELETSVTNLQEGVDTLTETVNIRKDNLDQAISEAEQFAQDAQNAVSGLTFGNLTESTSDILTISGGTGSVIGAGTTIQIKQASDLQSGFLSSTDWNIFNSKEPAIITGTTAQYYRGDKTFQDFDTSVRNSILTGFVTGSNTTLTATDSVLTAFQNIQGQINSKQNTLTNPITGTGTSGQVAFFNGTSTQTGDNGLFWDNVNKRLGIGTNAPSTKLEVIHTSTAGAVNIINTTGLGASSGGGIGLRTNAHATAENQRLGGFFFGSAVGAVEYSPVGIFAFSSQAHSDGSRGSYLTFEVSSNGSNVRSQVLRIFQTGNVLIQNGGTFTDAGFRLDVNGTARVQGNLTTNLTAGSVPFIGASGLLTQDNTNLFWDNTNKRLGIGTNAPAGSFEIVGTTAANSFATIYSDNAVGAGFFGRKARGTVASPTSPLSGDSLLGFGGSGIVSGAFVPSRAAIFFDASENWAASNNGTQIRFATTINGSTTRTDKLQIFNTGNVLIQNGGTFTDSGFRLDVNGTARVQGGLTVGTSALTISTASFTNSNSSYLLGADFTGNINRFIIKPISNIIPVFSIIQNDDTTARGAFFEFFGRGNTNSSNRESLRFILNNGFSVTGTQNAVIDTNSGGSGLTRALELRSGTNSGQIVLFTSGNTGINQDTDSGFRLDVNGTARVQGNLTTTGTITSNNGLVIIGSNGLGVASSTDLVITQNNTTAGGHRFVINQGGTLKDVFKIFRSTNVLIQDGGTYIDIPSAKLAINSTTTGFLPPRMTRLERLAISSPATGLIVYQTDGAEGLYQKLAGGWVSLEDNSIIQDLGSISGTVNIDLALGTLITATLTGATTLTFSGLPPSTRETAFTLRFSGIHAITLPAGTKYPAGAVPVPEGALYEIPCTINNAGELIVYGVINDIKTP